MKKKFLYMHTIDGHPAQYYPNEQICYAYGPKGFCWPLAKSREQIKEEQKKTYEWRKAHGYLNTVTYSYIKFLID